MSIRTTILVAVEAPDEAALSAIRAKIGAAAREHGTRTMILEAPNGVIDAVILRALNAAMSAPPKAKEH